MSQHIGRGWALACLVVGSMLGSTSASAQPLLPDASSARGPTTSTLELLMPEVVAAGSNASAPAASVVVDGKLQGLVDDLLSRSPAFRRQWRRLERFPRLSVRIELVHTNHVLDAHAATRVSVLPDGSQQAVMAIPGGRRLAELIAHEVEHILERLDGVKVASQHALGDASVRRASGTFETARAVLVGQMVAADVQRR